MERRRPAHHRSAQLYARECTACCMQHTHLIQKRATCRRQTFHCIHLRPRRPCAMIGCARLRGRQERATRILADPSCTRAFRHLNKPAPARRRQNISITKRVPNPPNHRLYAHHSDATGAAKLLTPISAFIGRVEDRKSGLQGARP
jgi:hypothetical protein